MTSRATISVVPDTSPLSEKFVRRKRQCDRASNNYV